MTATDTPAAKAPSGREGLGGLFAKPEVMVALIGLIGVLLTGVLSNWDKIFHAESTISERTDYEPTGNFETELRVYLEKSGVRAQLTDMQEQMMIAQEQQLLQQFPEDKEKIQKFVAAFKKEAPSFDSVVKLLLPIWQKHYTVAEIQELNKFYSSKTMQAMIAKNPLLTRETVPLMMQEMQRLQARAMELAMETFAEDLGDQPLE